MSVWDDIPAQERAIGLLRRDIESDRVAHAYLFAGPAGRLPLQTAVAFACALVCAERGCGACEACRRVAHHAHPDVELVEPAGMQLIVEQIRDVMRAAWRMPTAGGRRVIVVDQADRMNPNAQNAFLKALEEPPASTVIVLVTPAADALLETVRSRCREVQFRPLGAGDVARIVGAEGVDAPSAERWARVGGSLERARSLATSSDARDLREELTARLLRPARDPGDALDAADMLATRTRAIREAVAQARRADLAELADWVLETKKATEDRVRREQRRAEQDALEASLDDVTSVLRDLLVLLHDDEADLLNTDAASTLRERARELGPRAVPRVVACLTEVAQARRHLRSNANVLLTLERVFLTVHEQLNAL